MIKFFCDKCGKEVDRTFMYTGSIIHPEITNWNSPFIEDPANFELCDKCAKKLERFLQVDEDKERRDNNGNI